MGPERVVQVWNTRINWASKGLDQSGDVNILAIPDKHVKQSFVRKYQIIPH